MKSPLKKLRGFGFGKNHAKEKKVHPEKPKIDELVQAVQDMQEMRICYDGLLSAAAITINSAYEFSEALREMGSCLQEKVALNDDEESTKVLLMLGNVQFTLHKLVDNYRANIIRTISTPSESLLKELQTVEEMKHQCDNKRDLYKAMLASQEEKGSAKRTKRCTFSSKQLQAAHEDYEQEAALFIFRLKSLKQGQGRCLLTQATRHFAAQLNFFRKGLSYLESAEPHVKQAALGHNIEYGLEDAVFDEEIDDYSSYVGSNDELSFDFDQTNQTTADDSLVSITRKSTEVEQVGESIIVESVKATKKDPMHKKQVNLPDSSTIRLQPSSKSAPISSNITTDLSKLEFHTIHLSPGCNFKSYALPMPVDSNISASKGSRNTISSSSPLPVDSNKFPRSCEFPSRISERRKAYPAKNVKRHAYSGPLLSRGSSTTHALSVSDTVHFAPPRRPSVSPKPPRISELHELPLPPTDHEWPAKPSSLVGHSAPLFSRRHEIPPPSRIPHFSSPQATASLLPTTTMVRSLSIPMESQRLTSAADTIFSPPLSPISLTNAIPISAKS